MVLSAGYGTRLGDLTRTTPKPLLPLNGHPLLEYILTHLAKQGVAKVAINLHFMPEKVRNCLGDGSRWDIDIEYSDEPQLLGTAGGVKRMKRFLRENDAFLVQYGDVLTDQDFTEMLAFHHERQALATLLVHQRAGSNSIVAMDADCRILGFWERPDDKTRRAVGSSWVNSAICICDPAVLDMIPAGTPCDLPKDVFPKLVDTGRLFGFPLTGYRCAIDSPERYAEAQAAITEGRCRIALAPYGASDNESTRRLPSALA